MNWLDSLIAWLSPSAGMQRQAARRALALSSGYRTARQSRLDRGQSIVATPDWHLEVTRDRRELVDAARALIRDNALADGLIQRATENVIGCGIRPQAMSASESWNAKAEGLFNDWANREADVRGLASFWDLQSLVFRSLLTDGDVGLIKLSDGALQVVPSQMLASPQGEETNARFRDGVELDERGRPVRFHVVRDAGLWIPNPRTTAGRTAIDAENFLFLARRHSAEQTRGLPALAQTQRLFDQIDGLIEAIIVAARMAACFGLVVKSPFGPDHAALGQATGADGESYRIENFEPGSIKYLEDGEDIHQINPAQPSTNFPQFLSTLGRILGLQLGLPLELIFLDFSQTNYSSARAALLQAQRSFRCQQAYFVNRFLRPVYEWKIQQWVASGQLRGRSDALKVDFIPEPWALIDPVKELQGEQLALDIGVKDLGSVIRSHGREFADVLKRRKEQMDLIKEAELPVTHSTLTRDPVPGPDTGSNSEDTGEDPEQEPEQDDE